MSIAFSPDGACLASADALGNIHLWDINSGTCIRTLQDARTNFLFCVTFSPDGETIVSAGTLALAAALVGLLNHWDLSDESNNSNPTSHIQLDGCTIVSSVAYSADGRYIASGGVGPVRLWNTSDHSCVAVFEACRYPFYSVCFSPNGKILACGSSDGSLRFWNVQSKSCLLVLPSHHAGGVYSTRFSPDGKTIASGGLNETVRLWNPYEEQKRDKQYDWEEIFCLWSFKS
jgi:WD40 repeat protein